MRRWTIGGLAACAVLGLYLAAANRRSAPPGPLDAPVAAAPTPTPPAAPAVLPRVVEVTDLDPLLDPPDRPATGVPFDPEPASVPASAPFPELIPRAVD